jgi:methylated-DNA-[protein]-cysteine S-methyltransferase
MIEYRWIESPLGQLLLTGDGRSLTGLYLEGQKHFPQQTQNWQKAKAVNPALNQAEAQLAEYFTGQRQRFDLPTEPAGTEFQRQVWLLLQQIPFGETCSYGELAKMLGKPTAARAIGAANGRNPISIVVPCHRVIALSGHLTGYAGGLTRKEWLLAHERATIQRSL